MTEVLKIKGQKYGGILYVKDIEGLEITADEDDDILTVQKIVFTNDEDLIGKFIEQVSARHLRQDLVLIRNVR